MEEQLQTWYNAFEPLIEKWGHGFVNVFTLANWTVMLILVVLVVLGTRRMTAVPRGWQNLWEWVYEVFRGFAVGVIGTGGEKYLPLLATLFIYIFFLNMFGIIPGCLSPTTSLNMTVALAIVVFCAVQYFGFRASGLGYLKHFMGDPPWLAPLNIPIHVIGELAKPVSLSVRLFGNIFGEDKTVAAFLDLSTQIFHAIHVPLPLHLPMVAFAIFGGFIQAFVFTTLTAAYIGMATQHEGHEEHVAHEEAPGPVATDATPAA
ncbi:F0F1 ATP synthase subunit A [bacterium]|nr:F0F1 ATP synthase subunit A [bacterium]